MSASDKYYHWTNEVVRQYLRGELSPADMHALEKAALEDPLLSDALEGMGREVAHRGPDTLDADLQIIKERMAARISEKRKTPLLVPFSRSFGKVAAAVVVIAGAGIWTAHFLTNGAGTNAPMASAKVNALTANPSASDSGVARVTPPPSPKTGEASGPDGASEPTRASEPTGRARPAKIPPVTGQVAKSNAVAGATGGKPASAPKLHLAYRSDDRDNYNFHVTPSDSLKGPDKAKNFYSAHPSANKDTGIAYLSPPINSTALRSGFANQSFDRYRYKPVRIRGSRTFDNDSNSVFVGKVLDNNNTPVPYATISINNSKQVASSDLNGYFSFKLLGSPDSLAPVLVSSAGYHPASLTLNAFTLSNNASNVVHLQPDLRALNDVVVSGDGNQRHDEERSNPAFTREKKTQALGTEAIAPAAQNAATRYASPQNGWDAFQSYLQKHSRDGGGDSLLRGREVVTFQVDRKGKLSDFRILQSLSPAHDSLLIHLIRTGPVWKPLTGKKAGVTVTMSF